MSGKRIEWRGDLLAADLEAASRRVRLLPAIPRLLQHTLTIFLHPEDETEMDLERMVRLRAYDDLPALSAGAIAGRLAEEITGKLQSKALSGDTLALGIATARGGAGRAPRVPGPGGTVFRPRSIRVSQRVHYSFAPGAAFPFDAEAERMRESHRRSRPASVPRRPGRPRRAARPARAPHRDQGPDP